ncbi:MAG: hypothetical protein KKB20_11240 [Proteobacteria bacterium]|nr:hypothetical protein [Pseudomonadota bacterium]
MTAGLRLLIRAALSVAAAFFLGYFYFGWVDLRWMLLMAALLLGASYLFEALRQGRDNNGPPGPS